MIFAFGVILNESEDCFDRASVKADLAHIIGADTVAVRSWMAQSKVFLADVFIWRMPLDYQRRDRRFTDRTAN